MDINPLKIKARMLDRQHQEIKQERKEIKRSMGYVIKSLREHHGMSQVALNEALAAKGILFHAARGEKPLDGEGYAFDKLIAVIEFLERLEK